MLNRDDLIISVFAINALLKKKNPVFQWTIYFKIVKTTILYYSNMRHPVASGVFEMAFGLPPTLLEYNLPKV